MNYYHQEIEHLQEFYIKFKVGVTATKEVVLTNLNKVEFRFKGNIYMVLIEDEYSDLKIDNPLLHLLLVLRELAIIDDSTDFLDWCNIQNINNIELLDYYKNTISLIDLIKKETYKNEIDYFITDMDFELNSGVMKELRI